MISIEPIAPAHFPLAAEWLTNPAINRWLTSEWRGRQVDDRTLAIAVRNKRNRLFLVSFKDQPCGIVALAAIDLDDGTAMIWYLLGKQDIGSRGIITNAIGQMVQWGFKDLGLQSIYAWIMEDNLPSRRAIEKSGFQQAGRIRLSTNSDGQQVDRIYYDIIPTDLAPNKG